MGKSNDMDSGIGWAISRLIPKGHQKVTSVKKQSKTKKWLHNEFKVAFCPTCNRVWDWHRISNWVNVLYYTDFPKYGLSKSVCYICDPNEYKGSTNQIRVRSL